MQSRKFFSFAAMLTIFTTLGLLFTALVPPASYAAPSAVTPQAGPLPLVDDFETPFNNGVDPNNVNVGFFTAQDNASTTTFTRTTTLPAPLPGGPTPNNALKATFNVVSYGVVIHNFENATANQWVSQDWSSYAGIGLWVYGNNSNTSLFLDVIDNRQPNSTKDDAERFTVTFKDDFSGWKYLQFPFDSFVRKEIGNGAPNDGFTLTEVYGWAFGTLTTTAPQTFYIDNVALYGTAPVQPVKVSFTTSSYNVNEGLTGRLTAKLSKVATTTVTIQYQIMPGGTATANFDYVPVAGTLTFAPGVTQQTFSVATTDDSNYESDESVLFRLYNPTPADVQLGIPSVARLNIQDNDPYDANLLDDFEYSPYNLTSNSQTALKLTEIKSNTPQAIPGQDASEMVLEATNKASNIGEYNFGHRFAQGQDWRAASGLNFWYYGRNTNRVVTVGLLDNQAADPGPTGWNLVWGDEFNGEAGSGVNPAIWTPEVGDGTVNGNPGWGNSEFQYYTSGTDNAAMDGTGNLVITVKKQDANTPLQCYYGPCKYTSARLLTTNKVEVAYGRVEARVLVPRGAGLWPAFWMLGTDIDRVNWPQSGEIDIMENVGRLPKRVYGTIHGPGYFGAGGFGKYYDLAEDLANDYHIFRVDWQPNKIEWYIDGVKYHQATPADVAPNQWVFNHPFYMLLNVAVGGNFGGDVGAETTFPQTMKVDYVRVYQAVDSAERFETTFADNFSGWQQVNLPFANFRRSKAQPPNAPNDGLTLSSVQGYQFKALNNLPGSIMIDRVRLIPNCPATVTVSNTADSGTGSLRDALSLVCSGGTVQFSSTLNGATIKLTSGEIALAKPVAIDGAGAPNLTLSGENTQRLFTVNAKTNVTIRNLKLTKGYGWELAGAILNNGTLLLENVTVADSKVATSGADWWKGGAGIYNGENAFLTLRNSTIYNNQTTNADGGGIYAYFNTMVRLENSTVYSNSTTGVGGGLRTLGDAELVNSTLSANVALGWHGGAIFHTDGIMRLTNVTLTANQSPSGTAGGFFVGTFTANSPSLWLVNTIVANNSGAQCFVGRFGSGAVTYTSGGTNLSSDNSCEFTATGDIPSSNPQLGALANNGGATLTHALLASSPAIDAGNPAFCPATDQRGISRPQGVRCDIGSVEYQGTPTKPQPKTQQPVKR